LTLGEALKALSRVHQKYTLRIRVVA